jgi:hypothetical protein
VDCSVIILPNVTVGNAFVTLTEVYRISLNEMLMIEASFSLIAIIKVNKYKFIINALLSCIA